ncbi:MAG TPA: hypothetical protein VFQ61_05375 [Polyangiaceae bacterium]|nr:hypothetical protein [Polyangiaceae bacterium]
MLLAALALGACGATDGEAPVADHVEQAIANQEVLYTYYDCAHLDQVVGTRFHACVATNAWSQDGRTSRCFEVESFDCSNEHGTLQYCEFDVCAAYDPFGSIPAFTEWAQSN